MSENQDAKEAIGEISRRIELITTENRALFQRLLDGERRFRRLAKAVWMVQEDERRRLARELHDGIGQTLTALKNHLARLEMRHSSDQNLNGALKDSVELVSTALNDTRELSRLLRPAVLDDLGLEAALAWLTRTLSQRTEITIDLQCDIGDQRLETEIETMVFRIVQESLTNVIKHAGVTEASVTVALIGGNLRVQIQDKGKGFDLDDVLKPTSEPMGAGMRGMRDRVELFGGRLSIRSIPDNGTVIELGVPVDISEDNSD